MDDDRSQQPTFVSTFSLMALLLTIVAWELEVGVVLLKLFVRKPLDPLAHTTLLAIAGILTCFSIYRGQREFQALRSARGRIPLTHSQVLVVTGFFIAFGGVFGWIFGRLAEN
jgi:hypothetical protein